MRERGAQTHDLTECAGFMTDPRHDRDTSHRAAEAGEQDIVRYPESEVLSIVDTCEQVESVLRALQSSGFLESEVSVVSGQKAADALKSSTGRTGFTDLVLRIAGRLGLQNDETETKSQYEEALRNGHYVVGVFAPTDARKELAAQLVASKGGRFINFLGKFSIERLGK